MLCLPHDNMVYILYRRYLNALAIGQAPASSASCNKWRAYCIFMLRELRSYYVCANVGIDDDSSPRNNSGTGCIADELVILACL